MPCQRNNWVHLCENMQCFSASSNCERSALKTICSDKYLIGANCSWLQDYVQSNNWHWFCIIHCGMHWIVRFFFLFLPFFIHITLSTREIFILPHNQCPMHIHDRKVCNARSLFTSLTKCSSHTILAIVRTTTKRIERWNDIQRFLFYVQINSL